MKNVKSSLVDVPYIKISNELDITHYGSNYIENSYKNTQKRI